MEECNLQKRLNNVLLVSDIDGTLINHDFKIPKWISEKEIVKWSIMEGSDSWIYLNIKVK